MMDDLRVLWLCSTSRCLGLDVPARWRVFWPGRHALLVCDGCNTALQTIANAMGFHLVSLPVEQSGDPFPPLTGSGSTGGDPPKAA